MKKISVFFFIASFSSLFFVNEGITNSQIDAIEKTMNDTIEADVTAGNAVKSWHEEQNALIDELRLLKVEVQWLELQNTKLTHYTKNTQSKIDALQTTNSHYAIIALKLESSMWSFYDELEAFVNDDLPFLREERKSRLAFLKESLDNPELSIGEKFRRFSEAQNVEASYGTDISIELDNAVFDGKKTDLFTVRVGRVEYYALTLDHSQSGIWSRQERAFKKTQTPEEHKEILDLEEMAANKQFLQLINIPLRRYENAN